MTYIYYISMTYIYIKLNTFGLVVMGSAQWHFVFFVYINPNEMHIY